MGRNWASLAVAWECSALDDSDLPCHCCSLPLAVEKFAAAADDDAVVVAAAAKNVVAVDESHTRVDDPAGHAVVVAAAVGPYRSDLANDRVDC